ncbi:NAD(P)/FAD-dependent oxidoreductase [Enterobacteriaceae bacterium ET-AT1-13]|nr:NAD(P)/FAD-dependent oxidoreductase [Enterobacteriaceae bacterium ET-AT1-13]WMC17680.1 MAG: NAD(P)/FAD-dependent oxidoreductase [Enterobacteriaceae bacterium PSmelAO3-2]WMC17884.1 MAG: NAD(P)/FAD-dependent oxidoreductase [Enterobacteriaceae bacterium PSmelAO3-1]
MNKNKKIVIIGGGISGLELIKLLGKKIGYKNITLIDKNLFHVWKPILHEIASGYLDANINTINFLDHAKDNNYNFKLGTLININRYKKFITYEYLNNLENKKKKIKKLNYNILIIAIGSISNDFNIPGIKKKCFFLDNIKHAMLLHKKLFNILLTFNNDKIYDIKNLIKINIVIIGGGATGIELSAEIVNLIKELKKYGYNYFDNKKINITIIEAGSKILSLLPNKISIYVYNILKKININILVNTLVTNIYEHGLKTKTNFYINADLIIWTAGIKVPDFIKHIKGLEINSINQLIIKSTLQTTLDNNIFAIGDCSSLKINNKFIPACAQSAHQMVKICCKNIISILNKTSMSVFKYIDYGTLISLSEFNTIGYLVLNIINKKIIIKGKLARFLYITLYKMHQIKIQGYNKTFLFLIVNIINKFIRPKIKIK